RLWLDDAHRRGHARRAPSGAGRLRHRHGPHGRGRRRPRRGGHRGGELLRARLGLGGTRSPRLRRCRPPDRAEGRVSTTPAGASGRSSREILALAVPAFFALVAEPLFLLVDSAVVGRLGVTPLAGLGAASAVLLTASGLFVFLAYGTTSVVARQLG